MAEGPRDAVVSIEYSLQSMNDLGILDHDCTNDCTHLDRCAVMQHNHTVWTTTTHDCTHTQYPIYLLTIKARLHSPFLAPSQLCEDVFVVLCRVQWRQGISAVLLPALCKQQLWEFRFPFAHIASQAPDINAMHCQAVSEANSN